MDTGTVVVLVLVIVVVIAAAVLVPVVRRRGRTRGAAASAKLAPLGQMGANPNASPKDHGRPTRSDTTGPTV